LTQYQGSKGHSATSDVIIAELATDMEKRSLVIPFLASASFSMLLGSWRVRVFKVECAVAGKGEFKAGMKILRSSSASTG
jgi:hypothetical protein